MDNRAVFVGRTNELARGDRGIDQAIEGNEATLLLFFGEAGVGKTRLVQTIATAAGLRGARVVWGRAWEAGGAPSYWPWIQIFRALGMTSDPFAFEPYEAELPQARFAKFDQAARWLKAEATERPIVIALDDLHVADISSLLFLHFIVRHHRLGSRFLLLGTYREAEARRDSQVAELLAKITREGEAIGLDRLSKEDVLNWIVASTGDEREKARHDAERIHAVTEGNPLFVHEVLGLRGRDGDRMTRSIGLRAILDEHLAKVSAKTRTLLEVASVLGRDIDMDVLVCVAGLPRTEVELALREAEDNGLLSSLIGAGRLSFAHILLRERLYSELLTSRRGDLHSAAAAAIIEAGGDLATATHHLFESSRPDVEIATSALAAARAALRRLAFEDAVMLCERALDKRTADDEVTTDLELALGEALMRIGKGARGREVCTRAALRARRLGAAVRQGEAALAYAIEIASGSVDPTMVDLLQTAIDALPVEDSPLRARLLARHAAALVPPRNDADRELVIRQNAEALAIARRVGDHDSLLYALQYAAAGSGYLIGFEERAATLGELVHLARALDRPITLLAIAGVWIGVLRELGRIDDARSMLKEYERLIEAFPQPYYQWRIKLLRGTLKVLDGDFEGGLREGELALTIANDSDAMQGTVAGAFFRLSVACLRNELSGIRGVDPLFVVIRRMPAGNHIADLLLQAVGEKRDIEPDYDALAASANHFPTCLMASDLAAMTGSRDLAAKLYPRTCEHARRNSLFWAPFGSVVFGPVQRIAGDLARMLGKVDEARSWYESALTLGRRMESRLFIEIAQSRLAELGEPSAAPRSRRGEKSVRDIVLHKDGEMWSVSSSNGIVTRLKDSKGLHYLAHLVSHPGQEVHVTQLADLGVVSADAGAVLDAAAKQQYKKRIEVLRDRLEDAEALGDATRAEAIKEELEAVSNELAGAVGLGGRDRKIGAQVERIRINVQRRLKDTMDRIAEHDVELARYLTATVKTGVFCVFSPL